MNEPQLKLWERMVFTIFLCLSGAFTVVGVATIIAWVLDR